MHPIIMMPMSVTLSNPLTRSAALSAVLAAVIALGSTTLHAQEEADPTLSIPKFWLAQANDPAVTRQAEVRDQKGGVCFILGVQCGRTQSDNCGEYRAESGGSGERVGQGHRHGHDDDRMQWIAATLQQEYFAVCTTTNRARTVCKLNDSSPEMVEPLTIDKLKNVSL